MISTVRHARIHQGDTLLGSNWRLELPFNLTRSHQPLLTLLLLLLLGFFINHGLEELLALLSISLLSCLSQDILDDSEASTFGLAGRERLIIEDLLWNLHRRVIRKPAFPGRRLVLLGEDLIVRSV